MPHSPDLPSKEDYFAYWKSHDIFTPEPRSGPGIDRALEVMNSLFLNGGARFACFRFSSPLIFQSSLNREQYHEIHFFEHLLASKAFHQAIPDVQPYQTPQQPLTWEYLTPYNLAGNIAQQIMMGGPYQQFEGTGAEAMKIGSQLTEDLFGSRYEDIRVFRCFKPWSNWFYDVAYSWDITWIGVDTRNSLIWTIFHTDSD